MISNRRPRPRSSVQTPHTEGCSQLKRAAGEKRSTYCRDFASIENKIRRKKKIRKRKEKCGEPEAELCEEDEEEEEKDGQEVGEGCKCDPVTSGWRGT